MRVRAQPHPVRRDILERLQLPGATLTAAELVEGEVTRTTAHYHLAVLREAGAVEIAETVGDCGRTFRVYRATPTGQALASQ